MIWVVWLILTVLFFALGILNYRESRRQMKGFSLEKGPRLGAWNGMKTSAQDVKDFAAHFNQYIEDYNAASRRSNLIAAAGYAVAGVTSIVSMILSIAD